MIEHAAETEARGAVACAAVYICDRMAHALIRCIDAMTGVTPIADNRRTAVIGEGIFEARRRVAFTTLSAGIRMGRGRCSVSRNCPVMATRARSQDARVIKTAVEIQRQKMR